MMNLKAFVAKSLKKIGLYNSVRKVLINLGLHVPVPHGHSILIKAIERKAEELSEGLEGKLCIEIGSTRELLPGQGSTAEIATKCKEHKIRFLTVDMDPENTRAAHDTLSSISENFKAVNSKGELFLQNFEEKIDFLYLDAFDIDHGMHSEQRKSRYIQYLGADINNEDCYKMHLDCAVEAARLIEPGGVIVFDDAWRNGEGWGGKGFSAMPFLLNNGFRVIEETSNTVWLEREFIV